MSTIASAIASAALIILITIGTASALAPSSPPLHRHHAAVHDSATKRALVAGSQHLISNARFGGGTSAPEAAQVAGVTYGPHAVGFRAVCDTAGRGTATREQLLIWYPAQRPASSTPMRFSEYLAPSRAQQCGIPAATQEQRDSAIRVFARQLATASGPAGQSEPVGGRLFPHDSALSIAAALAAATTRSYDAAEPAAGNFPIVVFAPAGAIEQPVLMESLASHGYIVVSFPHIGSPPNGFAREGVESGAARDVTMAREFSRAIDAAVRFGNANGSRVAVMANGGFIPGAIWFQATTGRLSAIITSEGRVPGARLRTATTSSIGFRAGAGDSLPANFESAWTVPVLDWQSMNNDYTRGVLESFTSAERIQLYARVSHPAIWAARRLVHPADTVANTANDVMSAYVLKFLQYTLERLPGASEYFDRSPEANGVPAGFLTIQRVR